MVSFCNRRLLRFHPASRGLSGRARIVAFLAMLAIAPLLASCGKEGADQNKAAAPAPPTPVGVIEVAEHPTNPGHSFVGRVEAIDNVSLIARVDSFLNKRAYTEGQAVKAGDLLFVLEKNTFQASVDSAQANLDKAQADAANLKIQTERARTLFQQKTGTQAALDNAVAAEKQGQAVVAQAKASLEQAQINLGYTEIRAPFAGRVSAANFSVGALVGPSAGPLATIVSQDPIYVTFPVSDRIILEFTAGDRASATTGNIAVHLTLSNNMVYPEVGVIDYTGIKVDPNTDTLTVRAKFPNPKDTLLDGQFVRILAESKKPVEALLVPQKAVLTDQSGNYVLTVGDGNKVVQRAVTQGQTVGSDVVIQSGLKAGDVVITDGLQRVRPGQVVAPQPVTEAAPAAQPAEPAGK
ncbi:membrane fusion protein (multidrug efflux system) [Mesorhizobium soli]|jgi:membrane fusion protein (multidrug efflux system)|uniref:efflux RND transporter periplasmic adaptor subunit n=1 Tax=Pseudaminobacter soli (ex Li et al. 2025) TaxID=1295366 RepID=UPI00247CB51A|nr:membrane fusion protein (multidrug efflux system) [Mesorhizobium soli]